MADSAGTSDVCVLFEIKDIIHYPQKRKDHSYVGYTLSVSVYINSRPIYLILKYLYTDLNK